MGENHSDKDSLFLVWVPCIKLSLGRIAFWFLVGFCAGALLTLLVCTMMIFWIM